MDNESIKNNGPIRKFLQIFDLRKLSCSTPRSPSAVQGKSFKSDQSGRYEFLKKNFTEGSIGERKISKIHLTPAPKVKLNALWHTYRNYQGAVFHQVSLVYKTCQGAFCAFKCLTFKERYLENGAIYRRKSDTLVISSIRRVQRYIGLHCQYLSELNGMEGITTPQPLFALTNLDC